MGSGGGGGGTPSNAKMNAGWITSVYHTYKKHKNKCVSKSTKRYISINIIFSEQNVIIFVIIMKIIGSITIIFLLSDHILPIWSTLFVMERKK